MVDNARDVQKDDGRNSLILVSRTGQKLGEIQVLTAVSMKETVSTSETPVNFYQTTRRNIPEDSHFQVKSLILFVDGEKGE
jgi:hypothetical protein